MIKTRRIFSKYFRLIVLGFMLVQLISVGIYWLFVGKPLAHKASQQMVSELVLQTTAGVFKNTESELLIWRPIPRFIRQELSNHFQQHVTVIKSESKDQIIYYFNILSANKYIELPLMKLDFYPPQAMLYSLLLVVFISVLMAGLIARQIAVPIKEISQNILNIGEGQAVDRAHCSTILELNELQNKVNWMQSRINQLLRHNNLNYAGFSHDLKTPITQLNLALALIKSDITDKKFNQMQLSLNNMTDKVDDFIKQSKVLINEEKVEVRITDLINQVILDLKQQVCEWQVNVKTDRDITVLVQGNRLKRMLGNLINNALKHAQTPVLVEIETAHNNEWISLSIKDTGNISAEKIKELNQAFQDQWHCMDSETNHSLGVMICYQLAFQSSWKLEFKQNKPNGLNAVVIMPLILA